MSSENVLTDPPTMATPDQLPTTKYMGPFAFLRRHYNGDYSLARSYWINTFLLCQLAPALIVLLLSQLGDSLPSRPISIALLSVTALGLVGWAWAVVGTWASANKHIAQGRSKGWATAAKFLIVIGTVRTIGDLGDTFPSLQEHLHTAMGEQPGPATRLEIRSDGRSLLFAGGVRDGSAEQLDKALEMAPGVTTIVFSSRGGWIREGKLLADVVRRRRLNTYVEDHCASACTIAFLAGHDRAAAPSAKIGFHASRRVGSMTTAPSTEDIDYLSDIFQQAGLPDSFIERAVTTPFEDMWYPTHAELLEAGVLTRKSMGGETAAFATIARSRNEIVAAFKDIDAYAALAERAPEDFERVIDAAWTKAQSGATDAEVILAARGELSQVLERLLGWASDESLVEFSALLQEQLEALRGRDYETCVELLYPTGKLASLSGILPPELLTREMALMAQVFREADAKYSIEPSQQDIDNVTDRALARMSDEHVAIFADDTDLKHRAPKAVCDGAIAYFAALNTLPLSERGTAIRIFYSAR
jgi:hypothetical protein